MRLLGRLTSGLALVLTCCWALTLAISGSSDGFLYLAPALLIVFPLLAGRYLGESLVIKLASRGRPRRHPRRANVRPAPKAPAVWLPRGTRLIAFSLAERPPPTAVLTQT
jgi:hypothetical protein